MKRVPVIVSLLVAMVVYVGAYAQSTPPTIVASLDKDTIMIGDRVTLTIEVERDVMQAIFFPTFDFKSAQANDGEEQQSVNVEQSIEIIHDFKPDTVKIDARRDKLRKRYELAMYDEGIYKLGRAQVLYLDKNVVDTIFAARENQVVVKTFQIDTTMKSVRDIKPQMTLKFRFGEISGYLSIAFAVLLLIALLLYILVRYLHSRGRNLSDIFKPAPPPPPHIVAIEALERLHNEKLWQNNKHKLYYSGLSDILRNYLAGAFGVGAMEMTTDEIVEALRESEITQKARMELISVLRDADLVKFAKATPEADENELAYNKAYYFVEETKPVEVEESAEEDLPTKNEKQ